MKHIAIGEEAPGYGRSNRYHRGIEGRRVAGGDERNGGNDDEKRGKNISLQDFVFGHPEEIRRGGDACGEHETDGHNAPFPGRDVPVSGMRRHEGQYVLPVEPCGHKDQHDGNGKPVPCNRSGKTGRVGNHQKRKSVRHRELLALDEHAHLFEARFRAQRFAGCGAWHERRKPLPPDRSLALGSCGVTGLFPRIRVLRRGFVLPYFAGCHRYALFGRPSHLSRGMPALAGAATGRLGENP